MIEGDDVPAFGDDVVVQVAGLIVAASFAMSTSPGAGRTSSTAASLGQELAVGSEADTFRVI